MGGVFDTSQWSSAHLHYDGFVIKSSQIRQSTDIIKTTGGKVAEVQLGRSGKLAILIIAQNVCNFLYPPTQELSETQNYALEHTFFPGTHDFR